MDAKFSPRVKEVISYSREEALRLGHDYIGVEHLLLGIISCFAMYSTDGGEILYHTQSHIIRFLVFFLYLTTNEKGGTVFPSISDIVSPCRQGSLLMFPPAWPWLHQGMKPIIQPKYIVGSYLHYHGN